MKSKELIEFMLITEVAKKLRVSKMTIYRYIKAKKLKAYKFWKDLRIDTQDFQDFLNSKVYK
jgi:excisionase family DNA binding protein